MPEISKITLPSGTTYDIKDATARSMATGNIILKGVTTTALTDEATTNPIKINNQDYTAVTGDAVFYSKKEFVFDGTKWHEFGDMSGLGALATKDSVSATYTPAGTVSKPTFSGTQAMLSFSYTMPSGFTNLGSNVEPPASAIAFETLNAVSVSSAGSFTGTEGNVSVTGTPAGTVSKPTTTVTLNTATKYVAASATGGGSKTDGTAASCTLPVLTTSVANETLTIGWSAGSFTPNVPTSVTMPSFSSQTIATSVKSASTTQPTFTGSALTSTGTFTPSGTLTAPSLSTTYDYFTLDMEGTGAAGTTYTPAGAVTKPTFTGTQATITST